MKERKSDEETLLVGIDGGHHLRVDLRTANGRRRFEEYYNLLILVDFIEDCPKIVSARGRHDWNQLSRQSIETAKDFKRAYGEHWQRKAVALRRELQKDLRNLLAPSIKLSRRPRYVPDWISSTVDLHLWKLLRKMNRMRIPWDTWIHSLPPSREWSNPTVGRWILDSVELKFGGRSYELVESLPEDCNPRQYLYKLVYDLLKTGALSRLKLCGQCDRIFVCASQKAEFCSDRCRWIFINRKRTKEGYFKENRKIRKRLEQRRAAVA
jgi:hypothetical protein